MSQEGEVSCPLCREQFKDPLFLPCGHTFCRSCLEKQGEELHCPLCSHHATSDCPPGLRNVCESFKNDGQDTDRELLRCGHSFCSSCLQESWKEQEEEEHRCPICGRRRNSRDTPPDLMDNTETSRTEGQHTDDITEENSRRE